MTSFSRQSSPSAEPRSGRGEGSFRLKTLGGAALLHVTPGGGALEVLGPGKHLAVAVYLASLSGRSASREHLIDLLWANLDLDGARHALRQTLWHLRKQLGSEIIVSRDQEVVLSARVDSDRVQFLEAIERRDHERAVGLYEGEFLPMFAAPGAADFETWGDMERFRLRAHFLDAAEAVAWKRLERGDPKGAKELAFRARDVHPLEQRSWRLLLEVLLAANDPVTARIEAEALERRLPADEDSPDPATQQVLSAVLDPSGHTSKRRTESALRPELIARAAEFARMLAAWRSAEGGRGRHIHVRGAAGIGKSRLMSEVGSRLRAMGVQVVQVRSTPGRRELAYALVSEIAGELAMLPGAERISRGAASVLAVLNPSLTDRFSIRPAGAHESDVLRQRDTALAELLAAATVRGPVALFVDDVHWADERSQALLHSLCERVSEHRLLVVTAARPSGATDGPGSGTEIVALEPLSSDDASALLASLGSLPEEEWAERFPARLCESAGGSPLLILETLRSALERGLLSLEDGCWGCPDPVKLEAELSRGGALRRRVEQCSQEEGRLLLLLCVAGTPVAPETLARAVPQGLDEVMRELQDMEVRGLVTADGKAWVPAHDEIGAAVIDGAEPEELRRAHAAVGRSLAEGAEGISGEPDRDRLLRSVRHLLAAGEGPEAGRIYDRWIRAARRRGDRRSLRTLGNEAVGRQDSAAVRRLTHSLPLATRLGISTPGPRQAVLAAAALGILVWTIARVLAPTPPPADAVLIVLRPGPGGVVAGYEVPIRREGWEELDAIDVMQVGRRIPALTGLPAYHGHVLHAPGGERWAYAGIVEESWGPDLFLLGADGVSERVTRVPGDDAPMAWSPDGRSLLFQTGRWNRNYWQDLAILDLETGEIRPLVRSDDSHSAAQWSPDGTRVVFHRNRVVADLTEASSPDDPRQICWITVDAGTERCLDIPLAETHPVGWTDTERVLVRGVDSTGITGLYHVRLEDGEMGMLHRGVKGAEVSPDGGWLAVLRDGPAAGTPAWYVHPVGRPDLAVALKVGMEDLAAWAIRWGHAREADGYLEYVDVVGPDTVMTGVPVRVRARGRDPRGRPVHLHALSWQVVDTTVAAFDGDTEVLLPRALGMTGVRVSAGGWREAAGRVTVVPLAYRMLWTEDWGDGLERRWVSFGNPRPSMTDWPAGGRAFWNRGDGFYGSGVYSRDEFQWSRGLGLEAEISTPRTGPRAQRVSVGFRAWTEAVEAWDHRTGGLVGPNARCEFTYPVGDGAGHLASARALGHQLKLAQTVASGEPYTVRIQIFPDGTCGVAVNGEPFFRGDLTTHDEAPDRIVLMGESLNTRILVGPVDVWEGVRDGVDWSVLVWDPASAGWLPSGRDG